jgi:hypothetical protein
MPILEKLSKLSEARHWTGSIPLEYHYTVGVAGEDFRRELKQNGKFLASKCPKCTNAYVPTRMYCPTCFVETKERVTINKPGYVYSFTTVRADKRGREAREATVVALVKFDGFEGGIVHRLEVEDPEKVKIGTKVEPVLKDVGSRNGALTDILAFRAID